MTRQASEANARVGTSLRACLAQCRTLSVGAIVKTGPRLSDSDMKDHWGAQSEAFATGGAIDDLLGGDRAL